MADKKDYYELLGVERSAGADEIKKAYRKLAMKYHPDRNQGDAAAADMFKEISEAYEVLSDPAKRQRYDQFGHAGMDSAFGPGGFDFSRDFTHGADMDLQDILGAIFGGGGSPFFHGFGGARERANPNAPRQGSNLMFDMDIDLEEALFGAKREIDFSATESCSECGGSGAAKGTKPEKCEHCGGRGTILSANGFIRMQQTCPVCGGTGKVVKTPCRKCRGEGRMPVRRNLTITVPQGAFDGMKLCAHGAGDGGWNGGPTGDLYIVFHLREHELFQRSGADLLCEVSVPMHIAALGGEVSVPTPDGVATIKIAAGTANGKMLRLRGKGAPITARQGGGRGDLMLQINIEVPAHLNSEQRKALETFSASKITSSTFPQQEHLRKQTEEFMRKRAALRGEK